MRVARAAGRSHAASATSRSVAATDASVSGSRAGISKNRFALDITTLVISVNVMVRGRGPQCSDYGLSSGEVHGDSPTRFTNSSTLVMLADDGGSSW